MNGIEDACPHEAATRAARCESCCNENGSLTPCVVAWLRMRTYAGVRQPRTGPHSPDPMRQAA